MWAFAFKKKPVQRAALVSDIISKKPDISCWFWPFVHNWRQRLNLKTSLDCIKEMFCFQQEVSWWFILNFWNRLNTHFLLCLIFKGILTHIILKEVKKKEGEIVTSWSSSFSNQQYFLTFSCQPTCQTSLSTATLTLACRLTRRCCYRRVDGRFHGPVNLLQSKDHQETERQTETEQQVTFIKGRTLSLSECTIKLFQTCSGSYDVVQRPQRIISSSAEQFVICADESEMLRFYILGSILTISLWVSQLKLARDNLFSL